MKLILEQWRKLLEGEVIDFPQPTPELKISKEDTHRVIALEYTLGALLEEFYGNQSEIPIGVLERVEKLVNTVEELLKK